MKINYIKINGFGKFKDKEIKLDDRINTIYGENETGKSSMLKFISSMLYGVSKNKNGKDITDFDKFKPWKTEEFSGKMKYTLDNNKSYEIFREFKKKNPIIYDEKMEDISKEFKIDKTKGIDFFTEQTGIDEDTFYNTAITEQEGIKLSKSSQNSIIQKISNLISSGDDNISYKKSIEKINKIQNEQVGTDRTFQKPINIIENKIRNLKDKKKELENYKDNIYDNSIEKGQLNFELNTEETNKEFLKEVKRNLENNRIKGAEINFNKNLEDDYNRKIEELNNKTNESVKEDVKYSKTSLREYYIILTIFIVASVCMFLFNNNFMVNTLFVIPVLIVIGIITITKKENKEKNNKINEVEENKEKIINEIKILKENKEFQKKEIDEKQKKLNSEIEKEKEILINTYIKSLDVEYLGNNINKNYDEVLKEIEQKENRINTIKFKIQIMESENKNINNKLEDLAKIEEELEYSEIERNELISLNNSFNLAKECLESAYAQVKENISPKFTENLCDIISKISDNRYQKVSFDDDKGLNVEIDNGKYIPVSRLSVGTIDQMYLSLRLSALNEISNESMPIILDEAFAYFDNERLKNMLKYIEKNYPNNQVIIFTCSNREKEALESIGIKYNLINLEK